MSPAAGHGRPKSCLSKRHSGLLGILTWAVVLCPGVKRDAAVAQSIFDRQELSADVALKGDGFYLPTVFGPTGLTGWAAFAAILVTFLLFDTFRSMINMSYYAMTGEMTTDYDERTSITTTRMVYSIAGYILGAAVTTVERSIY